MRDIASRIRSSVHAARLEAAGRTVRLGAAALAVALLVGVVGTAEAAAQEVDVTGTWNMTVQSQQGTTNPTVMLEQEGQELTGHYSSETLGEADVTGTVNGSEITFSFTASVGGQSVPVSYTATVDGDSMSGSLSLAGQNAGSFTAERG